MRCLIDIVHPVHAHFFIHLRKKLLAKGHEVFVFSRKKDVTCDLLDNKAVAHSRIGGDVSPNRLGQAWEFMTRTLCLVKEIKKKRAGVVLTCNPCGVWAARLTGVPSILDTTDGKASKIHYSLGGPFATHVTSPAALEDDLGPHHTTYPAYLHASYLRPGRFKADPGVLADLGDLSVGSYSFVRFVALSASHDHGEQGISWGQRRQLINYLETKGKVFIVSEGPLPADLQPYAFPLPAHRFLDALAFAKIQVGDGLSTAAEAAFLGVASVWMSSYGEKLNYLHKLERDYGLLRGVPVSEAHILQDVIEEELQLDPKERETAFKRFWAQEIDLIDWYADFIEQKLGDK